MQDLLNLKLLPLKSHATLARSPNKVSSEGPTKVFIYQILKVFEVFFFRRENKSKFSLYRTMTGERSGGYGREQGTDLTAPDNFVTKEVPRIS